jgi:membrane associated rhomboid family serine protease
MVIGAGLMLAGMFGLMSGSWTAAAVVGGICIGGFAAVLLLARAQSKKKRRPNPGRR